MTRDNATKIAKRIMARIEDERTIHLDSMVDEIVAGMALVTEVAPSEPSAEFKRAMEQLELQRMMEQLWRQEIGHTTGVFKISDMMRGVSTSQLSDDSIGLQATSDYEKAMQNAQIYGVGVYAVPGEETTIYAAKDSNPPYAYKGARISLEEVVNRGWSTQIMDFHGWMPDPNPITNYWIPKT